MQNGQKTYRREEQLLWCLKRNKVLINLRCIFPGQLVLHVIAAHGRGQDSPAQAEAEAPAAVDGGGRRHREPGDPRVHQPRVESDKAPEESQEGRIDEPLVD